MVEHGGEPIDGILVTRAQGVGVVTLCNPAKKNAFSPEMRRRLVVELQALGEDTAIRAIVLTGQGKDFCAGADLGRMASRADWPLLSKRLAIADTQPLVHILTAGAKPVVAAVEGDAFGGGFSIALACDFIVAARTARFSTAFARMGLFPDMGMLHTLTRRVGVGTARRLLFLAEPFDGIRAFELGVADILAEPGDTVAHAIALAREFEAMSPIATGAIKAALASDLTRLDDVLRMEVDLAPMCSTSPEHIALRARFLEKKS
jgi:enoyl-CoA hydratase/carnithine racemase